MTTTIRVIAMALAVAILLVGAVGTSLADCEWVGAGTDNKWQTPENWTNCGGNPPGVFADVVFTVPETGWDTCEFDFPSFDVGDLTITGDSPTFFTFHLLDFECRADALDLNDYTKIDIDDVLLAESGGSTLAGTLEMDIADIPVDAL